VSRSATSLGFIELAAIIPQWVAFDYRIY